jgi:hypothetical protein
LGTDQLAMTLCELMDLQDDIADALMWLAESWASDLPAPRVRVRRDGRGRPMPGVAPIERHLAHALMTSRVVVEK